MIFGYTCENLKKNLSNMAQNKNEIITNPNWWNRRSMIERCLIMFIVSSVIVIASLSFVIFIKFHSIEEKKSLYHMNQNNTGLCLSSQCVHSASSILEKLDTSINPCDDFYNFACGLWIAKTNIPDDKSSVNMFSIIEDTVADQLSSLLASDPEFTDIKPFIIAKFMYASCLATNEIETDGHNTLLKLLKNIGGWPVLQNENVNYTWTWEEITQQSSKLGLPTNYLLTFSVASDWMNSSKRILDLDEPRLGLIQEYLMNGLTEPHVQSYYEYMVDIAVLLGADRVFALEDLRKSLEFEIDLAKISMARSDRRNLTVILNRLTLSEIQTKFNYTDWENFLNGLLPNGIKIEQNEEISITSVMYLKKLGNILKRTPKRIIANYYIWRIVDYSIMYLSRDLREIYFLHKKRTTGQQSEEPRFKECTDIINNRLSAAVSALYVRRFFKNDSKSEALQMVKSIRTEFEMLLKEVSWMDENTRIEALRKLNRMETLIGYPDELLDDEKLINFYKNLNVSVTNTFFENILDIHKFFSDFEFRRIRYFFNKTDWVDHSKSAVVNAYYNGIENNIQFPAGIFQGAFFAEGRPKYMNYGAMGLVIGHEITHGFDDAGRQFNFDGNHVDWWHKDAKQQFVQKTKCIIDQYSNYQEPLVEKKLNGVNTQGENIADNGGVKVSYKAYRNWVKKNGKELLLPGLPFNDLQLFWISAAQSWCSVYTLETLKSKIVTEYHSPERFRIVGSFSNSKDFSKDFACSAGSKMNPYKKCEVW